MNVHTNMNFLHLQMNKFLLLYNSLGFRNQNDHKTQQSIKFYFSFYKFLFCYVFLFLIPPLIDYAYVRANDSLSFQRIQMTFTHIYIHGICCQTKKKHLKIKADLYYKALLEIFFYAF